MGALDLKDRKILYQLDINSRLPNSLIARKIGMSKQVVGFRLKRLIEENMISSFYPIIDISKLGFTVHKSFLRLQNLSKEKESELISFLVSHENVVWVASCDGKFDLAFGTWAKDMQSLDKTLTQINKKFGDHISERQIATIIRGDYFVRDYLVNKKQASSLRESFFGSTPSPMYLDISDWRILFLLAKNARATAIDISKEVSLSPDAIGRRIKKLERSGIIKHYNVVPNEENFPYLHYKVLVSFRSVSEKREKTLREYCRSNPSIIYSVKALGPWDFEIDLEVESVSQFREIMMDMKTKFSEILKDYSTLQIYQVHKYNFCPSIQT